MCLGWTGAERGSVTEGGCLSVSQGPLRAARGHSGLDPTSCACSVQKLARGSGAGAPPPPRPREGRAANSPSNGPDGRGFRLRGRAQLCPRRAKSPWTETNVAWLCSSKALLTFIYKNWGWAGRPRDGVSEPFSGGGLGGGGPRVTRDPLPLSPCHKATSVGFLSTGGGGLSHRRRCCTAQAGAPGQTFAAPLAEPRGGNSRRRPALRMPCPAARVVCSVACELWGNVGTQPLCPNRQPGACALPFPPRTPRQDA